MVGKDERWGYLGKEGALKNMEPGVVVVHEKVLHDHSLVCRAVKRDFCVLDAIYEAVDVGNWKR